MKKPFIVLFTVTLFCTALGQNNFVPVVTSPATLSRSIFSASITDLLPFGYVEEEFFLEGKARRYDFKINPDNAKPVNPLYPGSFFY